jgi:hypothetical protein
VDRSADVLTSAMLHDAVPFQFAISGMIISRNQADFFRDSFPDETIQRFGIGVLNDTS